MSVARSSTATATTATAERPRGRFAPSPTGRLHQGSLYTAVASYLDARAAGGQWLVRIEDVDHTRADPALAGEILATLEAFGLAWDGPVLYQSRQRPAYEAALARLADQGLLYPCTCSRAELPDAAPDGEARYPGTCRGGPRHPQRSAALRLRVPPGQTACHDRLQGTQAQDVAACVGDFVLRRRDGAAAYQLAVVVDDAAQQITDVVRGADLWSQTPRQVVLQQLLGLPTPRYLHLPLVVEPDGSKLSKRRRSLPVQPKNASRELAAALAALGLAPPPDLQGAPPAVLLQWAVQHWVPAALPRSPRAAWCTAAEDGGDGVARTAP